MKIKIIATLLFIFLFTISSFSQNQKLKITAGTTTLYAQFKNNETTKDFIKILPLTLHMSDLGNREKYSSISKELSLEGKIQTSFKKGDIAYWLGGGIAVFYNQDGHQVKSGLIVIAQIEKGIEIFKDSESINVKFELVDK